MRIMLQKTGNFANGLGTRKDIIVLPKLMLESPLEKTKQVHVNTNKNSKT